MPRIVRPQVQRRFRRSARCATRLRESTCQVRSTPSTTKPPRSHRRNVLFGPIRPALVCGWSMPGCAEQTAAAPQGFGAAQCAVFTRRAALAGRPSTGCRGPEVVRHSAAPRRRRRAARPFSGPPRRAMRPARQTGHRCRCAPCRDAAIAAAAPWRPGRDAGSHAVPPSTR